MKAPVRCLVPNGVKFRSLSRKLHMKIKNKHYIFILIIGIMAIIFVILRNSGGIKDIFQQEESVYEERIIERFAIPLDTSEKAEHVSDIPEKPFAIQVYSFQDRSKAEPAIEGLEKKDYPAYIVSQDLGEKGLWHRVWVGRFETKDEATKILDKIKREYKDSFIISR